jgi:hypothetical protein
MDALDYVGILCIEFFVARDGRLLVNELAPRPHNLGPPHVRCPPHQPVLSKAAFAARRRRARSASAGCHGQSPR